MVMQNLSGRGREKREAERRIYRLLQQKDPAAITLMYERFAPSLLGILQSMVYRKEVAEDLLQEAFIKIWKCARSYDPEKASLFTWSLLITKSVALDYIRTKGKRHNDQVISNGMYGTEPACRIDPGLDHLGAASFFNYLGHPERQILYRIYFKGETHVEVSREMQIPLGTVKTKVRKALMLFRTYTESRGKYTQPGNN